MRIPAILTVILAASWMPAPGQGFVNTLTTTGCTQIGDGCMFDIVAQEDIQVCLLEVDLIDAVHEISIYSRFGTHEGVENSPGAWQLEGVVSVPSFRNGGFTKIPIALDITLFQNERLAFYVTTNVPSGLRGITGGASGCASPSGITGQVRTSNPDLDVHWGSVVPRAFQLPVVRDRLVAHSVHYVTLPDRRQCVHFQRDSVRAEMIANRVPPAVAPRKSDGFEPAVTRLPTNGQAEVTISSTNVGGVFDLVVSPLPLKGVDDPDSPSNTPGGQIINLDWAGGPVFSIFGGATLGTYIPLPPPSPFGGPPTGTFPIQTGPPTQVSLQMIVLDSTHPDGFSLSQGVQLEIKPDPGLGPANTSLNPGTTLALGDDDHALMPLGFGFDFYGQSFTEVFVGSNGVLTFGAAPTGFGTQSVDIADGPPVVAPWANDWDPTLGGSVSFWTDLQGTWQVAWTGIRGFPGGPTASFSVTADQANGIVRYDYDPTSTPSLGVVGISGGLNGPFADGVDFSLAGPACPLVLDEGDGVFEPFNVPVPGFGVDLPGRQVVMDLVAGYPRTIR